MLRSFFLATIRYLRLWRFGLTPQAGARFSLKRLLTMLVFLPLLGAVALLHWCGLLLDEVFFRGYRRVEIKAPVFILGVPRSGTTHLHSVLAEDEQFTSFSLWECLFGLSVSARYFWRGLGRVDRLIGAPLKTAADWVLRRATGSLADVHPLTLDSPEEDYLALVPLFAAFILVVPFPGAPWLWRMGYFDRDMSATDKERVLEFYRSCLQRHLYVHGPDKTLLSKNAAFASLAGSLADHFPGSRFICCERDAAETLPSQLSALKGGIEAFGGEPQFFAERFLDLFTHYYPHLDGVMERLPAGRAITVPIKRQRTQLASAVRDIYGQLNLPLGDDFSARLDGLAAASREHRSAHRYTAEDFGFSQAFLRERFGGHA